MTDVNDMVTKVIHEAIDQTFLKIADLLSEFARSELVEDMSTTEALDYFASRLTRSTKVKK